MEQLTRQAARRWSATRGGRSLAPWLVASFTFAGLQLVDPIWALPMIGGFARIIWALVTVEDVDEILGLYVAAANGSFGSNAAEVLCSDLPAPDSSKAPVDWLLGSWRERLKAASGREDCPFGEHEVGCAHRPFRVDERHRHCWPEPFNHWADGVRAEGLTAS